MSDVRVGETFQRDGAFWMATAVERQENLLFYWHRIEAAWLCMGPLPLWANEPRTFYTAHRRKPEA